MLTISAEPPKDRFEPPLSVGKTTSFAWAERLTIDIIRQHTKTDDVPGVSDEMLELYRQAAVEAAEHYTGALLIGQKIVTEPIQGPSQLRFGKLTYKHVLKYPVSDGIVYLYGSSNANGNRTMRITPNTRTLRVPIFTGFIDLSNCCDPCSSHFLNAEMMAAYKAGYSCPADVPMGVVLGMLQFIAWVIEHPGDQLLSLRNREDSSTKGAMGTSNIALASGALETWRQYDDEAI
jgi:hypothetical protein